MLTAQRVPTMHREKGAARAHDVNDVALPRGPRVLKRMRMAYAARGVPAGRCIRKIQKNTV